MANKFINTIKSIIPFLAETKGELKRVTWPSRKQATQYTLIVIGASLAVAFFLGGLDFLFTYLINKFII
ncbi:MAG: preprotein translocase subunit SecE [Candidatus Portnoybacteria bacterium CG23_combo_of_CG06-09_8_20_14_all_37_13]|uniref:Protein translocase subunit SecE n=1 Tax=Candidatus Portnoybacteria bacterium CG23_combo_of_CG06-09_8_20_14_all_37_13 TaxID=1974819 RepID=A0A2G9YC80_9BACT|nr:MAG: preprotein translocase subunit SecE [Candidatus Portnoybacteria bacterium CG23_combo_of_CG06-09_8_20_14_all_37_13]